MLPNKRRINVHLRRIYVEFTSIYVHKSRFTSAVKGVRFQGSGKQRGQLSGVRTDRTWLKASDGILVVVIMSPLPSLTAAP